MLFYKRSEHNFIVSSETQLTNDFVFDCGRTFFSRIVFSCIKHITAFDKTMWHTFSRIGSCVFCRWNMKNTMCDTACGINTLRARRRAVYVRREFFESPGRVPLATWEPLGDGLRALTLSSHIVSTFMAVTKITRRRSLPPADVYYHTVHEVVFVHPR